jgi:Tfp pilus assembly protein PilX
MPNRSKKGVILFIVVGVIMVVAILATVMLRVIANQSRLTHHQISRIQAQYAARAGVIYALDKLRRNDDASCVSAGGWTMRSSGSAACDVIEPDLPNSVLDVVITVGASGSGVAGTRKVSATANYLYTP